MTANELMALVDRSLFAEIGYTDEQNRQNIRSVFCVWHRGLGRHLISTNTSSAHVQSLMRQGSACLYFSDPKAFEGLCLYGKVLLHFEREYKELLWNPGDEKYYPAGIDDPDYCIMEFIADSARYYRYDGKGELTQAGLLQFDEGRTFENGYAKTDVSPAE